MVVDIGRVDYIALATALMRASEMSRPSTARVRCKAGLNGAKLTDRRIRLNSSAGFLPVSTNSPLRAVCRLSGVQVARHDSFSTDCLSRFSSSASESFLRNLLFFLKKTTEFANLQKKQ